MNEAHESHRRLDRMTWQCFSMIFVSTELNILCIYKLYFAIDVSYFKWKFLSVRSGITLSVNDKCSAASYLEQHWDSYWGKAYK